MPCALLTLRSTGIVEHTKIHIQETVKTHQYAMRLRLSSVVWISSIDHSTKHSDALRSTIDQEHATLDTGDVRDTMMNPFIVDTTASAKSSTKSMY